jgi:hypothetical protein
MYYTVRIDAKFEDLPKTLQEKLLEKSRAHGLKSGLDLATVIEELRFDLPLTILEPKSL